MNTSQLFSLEGKSVLVTGAGRGNGSVIAAGLVKLGADVTGLDLNFPEENYPFRTALCDITDDSALTCALEVLSRIDGLVNNAGITLPPSNCYAAEAFERTIAVNTLAPMRLSWRVAEIMKANGGGSIVNVTSLGAHLGFPLNPAYQASKAALRQITKSVAVDYGSFGVRANNLCPGYILTDMTRASYDDPEKHRARSDRTMLGRWGLPEDLVGPCAFLLSPASAYVTGLDLSVDGGWLSKGF